MIGQWNAWLDTVIGSFSQFSVRDIIDIFLVAIVLYQLILLTKDTRAMQVLKGLGVLIVAQVLFSQLGLSAISWLLGEALSAGALAIVIIFQPELRRAFEKIGRGGVLGGKGANELEKVEIDNKAKQIADAMISLSARQVGALIVLEGRTALGDIAATGTRIEARISSALLQQIFEPNTPLHDGAVIIQDGIITAAGCFLPLSDNTSISRQLGTRHRAAMGVSEISDCLAFIVSEETGVISLAREGKLTRYVTEEQLVELIESTYDDEAGRANWLQVFFRIREKRKSKDDK